jgi:integrase/recombinase XerC
MFIERFIQYLKFEKRFSPHTVNAYQKDLLQFSAFINKMDWDIAAISHVHVRSFMVDLIEHEIDPRSINRKISVLRSYFKFLLREKLAEANPMLQVKAPKVSKRLPVVVEDVKLNQLLDTNTVFSDDFSGSRDRLVLELLFGTGIRLAELLTLKPSDINKWEQTIRVLGKRNKERIIPVNTSLLKLIEEYIRIKESAFDTISEHLIVTNDGLNAYPKLIYRIVNKYLSYISTQNKKSPHVLRHTFATSLLNKGADLNAIKELLGHSSLAATQVYTHNSVERLKSIYKQAHPKA